MSDYYEDLVASVDALEITPEQKQALLSKAKVLNVELGKSGSDLIKFKREAEELGKKNQTYKSFADSLAKYNLKAEDVKKMAENAGIQQTNQDVLDETTRILKESQTTVKSLQDQVRLYETEKTLSPLLDSSIKDFKDGEGKEVKLLPAFADGIKDELFKGIKEGDTEVVIQDRINKALTQAKSNQDSFLSANGLVPTNTPIHRVQEQSVISSVSDSNGIKPQDIKKQIQDGGGTVDAVAQAMANVRHQREQQNQ